MAVIKSGATTDELTVDPTSKAARSTLYTSAGVEKTGFVRSKSAMVAAVSFRTLGNAAATQNVFSIENPAASGTVVRVRRLWLSRTYTAVLVAVDCEVNVSRITSLPTGGTVLGKVLRDTSESSDTDIVCRGATASNGGVATAITATAGTLISQFLIGRIHTAVGIVSDTFLNVIGLITEGDEDEPWMLREGQAFLVQITNITAASNAATNHYIVGCEWDENAT